MSSFAAERSHIFANTRMVKLCYGNVETSLIPLVIFDHGNGHVSEKNLFFLSTLIKLLAAHSSVSPDTSLKDVVKY